MKIVRPENFENHILDEVLSRIKGLSEMTHSEKEFLNGIIRQAKPKKIIEIGVSAGGSSVIILNAIKDIEGSKLYSFDYSHGYYKNKNKKTGFLVDEFPELSDKWELYTGGISCKFLEETGGDVDICLLDAAHNNPGEILDYLQVLPYMKKNGIIIIHDTILHVLQAKPARTTCCVLLSIINGEKIIPTRNDRQSTREWYGFFPNMGAAVLNDNAMKNAFDAFNCIALPWAYMLSEDDIAHLLKHFKKYYDDYSIDWFLNSIEYNKTLFQKKAIQPVIVLGFKEQLENVEAQKQIDKLANSLKGKKIAVYGAGELSEAIFSNLDLSKLNIVAVADKKYKKNSKEKYFDIKTTSPSDLKNMDVDIILIATLNSGIILDYLEDEILVNCKNSHIKISPLIKIRKR